MDKITKYLASYATSLKYDDLPAEVVHKTKGLLLDTLGCAVGAYSSEPAKIARKIAGRVYQCDMPAAIIGSGQPSSLELATFANGIMIRYLDYNDVGGGGHRSDNFASVLTCADAVDASGKELIVAAVLAYEVMGRIASQTDLTTRGFDHTVPGVISCALGASKLLGLSKEQTAQAINLAITPNIALLQTRYEEVSMWKGCAMANAARNGVFAALLAREGMTGPSPVFEGRYGLFMAVTGPFKLGGFGKPFTILVSTIKRYPCGSQAQTEVDLAIKLRSKIASVNEIAEINIETRSGQGGSKNIMAGDAEKWHPTTRETADHSMPYVVALGLTYGTVELRHFDDEYLHNPELIDLMQKIKVTDTEECTRLAPENNAARVEIVTKSGQRFSEFALHCHGHYLDPLTNAEIEQKFNSLTRTLLTPAQRQELISLVWNLEKLDDASKIMPLLKI